MSELLPCPFCGGEAEYEYIENYANFISVKCSGRCVVYTHWYRTAEEAAEEWNTRVINDKALSDAYDLGYEKGKANAERTCTILGRAHYESDGYDFWETELSCGHTALTFYEMGIDEYCSTCGARVVREMVK